MSAASRATLIIAISAMAIYSGAADAQVLKKEPPRGELRCGSKVLVDDGTCPQGQIKEITGGCNLSAGGGGSGGGPPRQRRCINR